MEKFGFADLGIKIRGDSTCKDVLLGRSYCYDKCNQECSEGTGSLSAIQCKFLRNGKNGKKSADVFYQCICSAE